MLLPLTQSLPQCKDGPYNMAKWVVSLPFLLLKELRPSKGK